MKKVVPIALALLLALSLCSGALADPFTGTPVNPYDWRELTQWPVVGEGESLEISILARRDDTYGIDAKDMWLWNFLPEATGITMHVEQVSNAAKEEKVNLLLASNTLPDILWGLGLTTNQLVMYGQEEKLLLDVSPYVNADVMPNLTRLNDEFAPDLVPTATLPNGGMYALPYLGPNNPGASPTIMINKDWMAESGREEIPETLDDFVDMLYDFKEAHPESTPVGGSWEYNNPMMYILNAYGFLGNNNGLEIQVREGKAVVPAADPVFKEVLALMNRFYNDGIISKDFFTMDSVAVKAQMSEGLNGFYPNNASDVFDSTDYEHYSHWTTGTPLTSEYNETKQWPMPNLIQVGNMVCSANCPEPEKIMRFLDGFYSHEVYVFLHWGPIFGTGDGMGIHGGWAIQNWSVLYLDVNGENIGANTSAGMVSASNSVMGNGAFSFDFPHNTPKQYKFYVWGYDIDHPQYSENDMNGYYRIHHEVTLMPYETSAFPYIVYTGVDETYDLQELYTVLKPYMQAEIAKFITGQRSLDEFDQYLAELDGLGMDEYQGFYADYYENYLNN